MTWNLEMALSFVKVSLDTRSKIDGCAERKILDVFVVNNYIVIIIILCYCFTKVRPRNILH